MTKEKVKEEVNSLDKELQSYISEYSDLLKRDLAIPAAAYNEGVVHGILIGLRMIRHVKRMLENNT